MEKRAAIYCRLSREDDNLACDEVSESIQNQQKLLCEYAKKNGFSVYCMYVDENYSGLDNTRPAFCRMIEDARCGRFDTILCKNQSRFTRDMETAQYYLNELFPLWHVRLIGICDGVDTNDMKNLRLRQINGLINEWYSEDLSDNIRQILRDKMMRGQFIGSFACYGYTKEFLIRLLPPLYGKFISFILMDLVFQKSLLYSLKSRLCRHAFIRSSRAFYFRRLFLKIKSHMNLTAKFQNGLPQVYAIF